VVERIPNIDITKVFALALIRLVSITYC